MTVSKEAYEPTEQVCVTIDVTNTVEVFGEEVVQLFIRDNYASVVRPVQELAGFVRVPLHPNEARTIQFLMDLSQIAFLDTSMKWKIEAGEIEVMIGASSHDIRERGVFRMICSLTGAQEGFM
ncbi:fibronectin type III-like domain-contianing protein [Paenibacillus phytohabitans]|uniref:fibronectin type III-like domain-contianing protein n=1 Tax=Paenibacillus phytohabitans TaxID=2654978 RepID=UPI00300B758D